MSHAEYCYVEYHSDSLTTTLSEGLTMTTKQPEQWTVTYRGFLQAVTRAFKTKERAEQWARQVGVYNRALIAKATGQ